MKYRKKLFIYFLFVFAVFTAAVIVLQRNREEDYRLGTLRYSMDNYTDIIYRYVRMNGIDSTSVVVSLVPDNLRFTVVAHDGKVYFDNTLSEEQEQMLDSHLYRPEISEAVISGTGSAVRFSETKGVDYFYYAKRFPEFFVRVAYPYDSSLQSFLKADNYMIFVIFFLFVVTLFMLLYISDKFGKSVSGLNAFLTSVANDTPDYASIKFPDTEIGEIGSKIVSAYRTVAERNSELAMERKKLIQHFSNLDEGIAIFNADRNCVYYNSHFIRHLNMILDEATFSPESVFTSEEFADMNAFLSEPAANDGHLHRWSGRIGKGGNYFSVKTIVFEDGSFEIILSNISEEEKDRMLKREMTNNIAHELRTPVSSISGYIESMMNVNMDDERRNFYLHRADVQVRRLSDLIRDIGLITNMEEAPGMFDLECVSVKDTVKEVVDDLADQISEHSFSVDVHVEDDLTVEGSHTLLYSIFRNLIDNSLSYAGDGSRIVIDNYARDDQFCYFKVYDNGVGVPAEHLPKLFDRFYRVDKGRSRKNGGTGLGLSIVRNAVKFHKGSISAKNRSEGGLEFVFSLSLSH